MMMMNSKSMQQIVQDSRSFQVIRDIVESTVPHKLKSNVKYISRCLNKSLNSVSQDDFAALKMRGLPFSVRNDDIKQFFDKFDFHQNEIKIGRNQEGTKTGEGAILFTSEDECKQAFIEKQGQNIGHRWI